MYTRMGMNLGLTKCQLITYIHFTEIAPFTSITHNYLGKYIYTLALAGGRGAGMGSSSLHIKVWDTILYSGDFETIPKHIPKVWDCSQNVKSLHRVLNI